MLKNMQNRWADIDMQVFATSLANWVLISHGAATGWLSSALPTLMSNETPISTGPITNEELSWLGSISSIGSIVGTFVFGILTYFMGCKRAMMSLGVPSIIFWLCAYFGSTFPVLLFGRFSMGLTAGGIHSGIIVYVSEISNDNIRGRLASFTPMFRNFGVLGAYLIGLFGYDVIPAFFFVTPICYMICLYFLPNTPQYHLSKGNEKEAEDSIEFYMSYHDNNKRVEDAVKMKFEQLKNMAREPAMNDRLSIKDFCNRDAVKGIIIGIAMAWFLQFTGCFIIINYASLVFKESETLMNPHVSAVVLGLVQIFGGVISTSMSDLLGRKIQLIISLGGCAVGLICLAVFTYIDQRVFDLRNYSNLPVLLLSFVIFIANAGIANLSSVCTVENLPSKIRNAGMIFYTLWYNIVAFLGDKYFPILLEKIDTYGCFIFLAVNCCLGALFVIFCVKETKGQSLNSSSSRNTNNR